MYILLPLMFKSIGSIDGYCKGDLSTAETCTCKRSNIIKKNYYFFYYYEFNSFENKN